MISAWILLITHLLAMGIFIQKSEVKSIFVSGLIAVIAGLEIGGVI